MRVLRKGAEPIDLPKAYAGEALGTGWVSLRGLTIQWPCSCNESEAHDPILANLHPSAAARGCRSAALEPGIPDAATSRDSRTGCTGEEAEHCHRGRRG